MEHLQAVTLGLRGAFSRIEREIALANDKPKRQITSHYGNYRNGSWRDLHKDSAQRDLVLLFPCYWSIISQSTRNTVTSVSAYITMYDLPAIHRCRAERLGRIAEVNATILLKITTKHYLKKTFSYRHRWPMLRLLIDASNHENSVKRLKGSLKNLIVLSRSCYRGPIYQCHDQPLRRTILRQVSHFLPWCLSVARPFYVRFHEHPLFTIWQEWATEVRSSNGNAHQ